MVFTDVGRSGLALAFAGSMTKPNHICIGTGSGAITVSRTDLITQAGSTTFTSTSMATLKEFNLVADFGATTLSGLTLREFGVKSSDGTLWEIEALSDIACDGTIEVEIDVTFQVF